MDPDPCTNDPSGGGHIGNLKTGEKMTTRVDGGTWGKFE